MQRSQEFIFKTLQYIYEQCQNSSRLQLLCIVAESSRTTPQPFTVDCLQSSVSTPTVRVYPRIPGASAVRGSGRANSESEQPSSDSLLVFSLLVTLSGGIVLQTNANSRRGGSLCFLKDLLTFSLLFLCKLRSKVQLLSEPPPSFRELPSGRDPGVSPSTED
ncbi:hypothetical protein INR49_030513 [Caranx melampygus]|nr:hypothetical protein INR49_030513 [Caranx melampygus]